MNDASTMMAISAGSAIVGAVIVQLFAMLKSRWDKKHQKQVRQREKYEKLGVLVRDNQKWVTDEGHVSTGAFYVKRSSPEEAREAKGLALEYFPKLHADCADYVNACDKYLNLLKKRDKGHRLCEVDVQTEKQVQKAHDECLCQGDKVLTQIHKYTSDYAKA